MVPILLIRVSLGSVETGLSHLNILCVDICLAPIQYYSYSCFFVRFLVYETLQSLQCCPPFVVCFLAATYLCPRMTNSLSKKCPGLQKICLEDSKNCNVKLPKRNGEERKRNKVTFTCCIILSNEPYHCSKCPCDKKNHFLFFFRF